MIKSLLHISFLTFLYYFSSAQSSVIKLEVEKLFSDKSKITKQIELYGYKNGVYEIQLYLADNGEEWKGICYFPSSGDKLRLEGGFVNKKLILNELSSKGEILGMWQIDLSIKPVFAKWQNIGFTKSFDLELKELNKLNKSLEIIDDKEMIYEAVILNQNHQILVSQNGKTIDKVSVINLKNSNFLSNQTNCLSDNCNIFELKFDRGQKIRKLICKKKQKGLDILIWDDKRTKFNGQAILTKEIKLLNKSFINRYYNLNIKYPEVANKQFNSSINNAINTIANSLKSEMEHLYKSKNSIDNRLTLEAKAWFDIDYYSDYVISGRFIIQKSYSGITQIIPINFSLKSGKKINIYKQFSQDFNLDFFAKQFIKEKIKKLPEYKVSLSRNFLNPSNFKYLTLSKAGIVVSTGFNSIIGSYKIILPFSEIKNDIKRRSILKKIIKS